MQYDAKKKFFREIVLNFCIAESEKMCYNILWRQFKTV